MFQFVKWIALLAFGFVFYEVVTGMKAGMPKVAESGFHPRANAGRRSNLTGFSGQGTWVPVEDADGARHTTKVGRGVLS